MGKPTTSRTTRFLPYDKFRFLEFIHNKLNGIVAQAVLTLVCKFVSIEK